MALTPRLDLRQSQQLVMTPQLQQAIKLLQLSNLELGEFVEQEVERNPILEIGEPGGDVPGEMETGEGGGTASDEGLRDFSDDTFRDGRDDYGDAQEGGLIATDRGLETGIDNTAGSDSALDADYGDNVFNGDAVSDRVSAASDAPSGLSYDGAGAVRGAGGVGDDRGLDQTLEAGESLHDFLTHQMLVAVHAPADRMLAAHLIDLVNEAGYIDAAEVTDAAERLDCAEEDVDRVLGILQTFEPVGVFARTLGECLALQLKDLDRFDPCMQALVAHLDLLARGDLAALKRICGVDQEDLTDMIQEIRALNPKPGFAFGHEDVQAVVPDIFVSKAKTGEWVVELNSDTLPRVLVNSSYVAELSETASGEKEAKAFISECVSNANWLVKALDQRARTILKVATALVKKQDMFFEYGVRYLKPLTLKDIADEIDMHESTVSRVTSNKFLACPRGLFELKYFFTSSISATAGGDSHSAESVKFRIKELIDAEDPKKILSDDTIVDIMKREGVDIARRTVAKYREAMKIPSSVQRRRLKSI
ncbi:RNA polymerase factor sigma-54 [Gimibacter soli]|uniref:RNA polymerase sigma-54 factor n=1 Tax=Gimibacter soli TaxID=3024400 RepID=A0AAE9XTG9_9PROT|nr:RNA polymerase factor sigma-54 [Gimibacter soli]WCL54516.1 RNA polymerase factor sigma-54 [Gimibacter soli]